MAYPMVPPFDHKATGEIVYEMVTGQDCRIHCLRDASIKHAALAALLQDGHTTPPLVIAPPPLVSWGLQWAHAALKEHAVLEPKVCDGFMDCLCPAISAEQCPFQNEVPFPGFSICTDCRTGKIALIDLLPTRRECSQFTFLLFFILPGNETRTFHAGARSLSGFVHHCICS